MTELAELRRRIEADVAQFARLRHAAAAFDPADPRVPYAGRVFDDRELVAALDATLEFGLTLGAHGQAFARELAAWQDVLHAVFVNSGSSAILVALSALTSPLLGDAALAPGDEVVTQACGFPTTLNPILQAGFVPVLVDNDVATGNVDVESLRAAISPRTRAVVLPHTLGQPFDVEGVLAVCEEHSLWLVEDNCDAMGSRVDGRLTGSFGDLASLSFYPGHHMTTGEGGAVLVRDRPELARAAESFRDWGRDCWCRPGEDNACGRRFEQQLGTLPPGYDHKFTFSHVGFNLKPTEWQAAIGRAQLEKLDGFVAARRRNWRYLREELAGLDDVLQLPDEAPGTEPSWFGFMVVVREDAPFARDELVRAMEAAGIQTRMVLGGNLVRQPAIARLLDVSPDRLRVAGPLAGADRLMSDGFFFGVYPGLTEAHLAHVVSTVRGFVGR